MKKTGSRCFEGNKGFTIIEVLVAMTILALFITAFSALFVQSYTGIVAAGNKSNASYDAQADVEKRIAEKNSNAEQNLSINFGTQTIDINGGVVSSTKTKNNQSSSMDSFLALIPTMIIEPYLFGDAAANKIELYDGYPIPQPIKITGTETHFTGSSVLSIKDKNGFSVTGNTINVSSATLAKINLFAELNSASSPYLITITTVTEKVSAYLEIKPVVKYAAVGDSSVIAISDDALSWSVEEVGIEIANNNLNCITAHDGNFVTVGNLGIVMYSTYGGHVWTSVNLLANEADTDFKSIVWGNNKYVAVGTGGTVYTFEENLALRECRVNGTLGGSSLSDLNGVVFGKDDLGFDKYVAVGAAGTIIVSNNGINWNRITPSNSGLSDEFKGIRPDFNAITYGRIGGDNWFIAVGNDGIAVFSKDAVNWYYGIAAGSNGADDMPVIQYNSVVCADNRIIAAGDTSAIVINAVIEGSVNAVPVIRTTGSITGFSQTVNSVVYSNGKYWAILNRDTLINSNDGNTWYNGGKIGTATGMNSLYVR